ncbi:MAG: ATP-binding protein [archaeon]
MKMQDMNGYPEECLKLVREAEALEFSDSVRSKMNFLIAAKILMDIYLDDPEQGEAFKNEAQRLYDRYVAVGKKYGRVVSLTGGKVVSKFGSSHSVVTPIEPTIKVVPRVIKQMPSAGQINRPMQSHEPLALGERTTKSNIRLDSVCGLEEMKDNIILKIVAPLRNPEVCEFYGKTGKAGILMYGPPGCGKSLVAEAIANEVGASFFNVKASDLKSKWVGETEKKMADLFALARTRQPAIIFIDEFESLGRERSNVNNSFEKDFISQLLVEIDGMGNKDSKITLIAATNQPWEIDSALLRSGRFGTKLFIAPPTAEARQQILEKALAKKPVDEDVDFDGLVASTSGFSGADMVELCNAATENAMKEYFIVGGNLRKINNEDFTVALGKIKPVTKTWLKNALGQVRAKGMEDEYKDILEYEF